MAHRSTGSRVDPQAGPFQSGRFQPGRFQPLLRRRGPAAAAGLLAGLLFASIPVAGAAPLPEPGRWEMSTTIEVDGEGKGNEALDRTLTEEDCIAAESVSKNWKHLIDSDSDEECRSTILSETNREVVFTQTCGRERTDATIRVIDRKRWESDGKVITPDLTGRIRTRARWLDNDCKP